MKISVIIPTLNEEKRIGILLNTLKAQTEKPDEVLVIDAFSKDQTAEIVLRYPDVQLYTHGPGVGFQRQYGGERASGDLLIFLDADTEIPETFLQQVKEIFVQNNLQVACPRYLPSSKKKSMIFIYQAFNLLFRIFERVSPSGAGSCIITTQKAFRGTGGFDGTLQFDDIAYIRKAGRAYGFKQLPIEILVSDRRFHEYGVIRMLLIYAILSLLFVLGLFRLSNHVRYTFGSYKKQ